IHIVLLAAVLALWPVPAEWSPVGRGAHAVSGEPRTPTSLPRTLSKNGVKAASLAQSARDAVNAPETSLPLVPAIVGSAREAAGDRMLNHLWQSTLFAVVIAGLTLAFRKHDARVRYWMWFAASVKFLVPFSALEGVGASWFGPALASLFGLSATPSIAPASVPLTFAQISQPFAGAVTGGSSAVTPDGGAAWLPIALLIVWALGVEFVVMHRLRAWRTVRSAVRASALIRLAADHLPAKTPIRSSPTVLEPALVGLAAPILLPP